MDGQSLLRLDVCGIWGHLFESRCVNVCVQETCEGGVVYLAVIK